MNLSDLEVKVRALLNNPATTELSNTVIDYSWARALDRYSQFKSRKEFYYAAEFKTIANIQKYDIPAETMSIRACRIYTLLADLKADINNFEDYEINQPGYTGYGDFDWAFLNNLLELSKIPATEDAGKFIGLLLYKAHVFTSGVCSTIPRAEFEGHLLNWVKGDLLETWAGYAGSMSYGSGREDRGPLREEARKLKEAAEKSWAAGLV